MVLHKAHQLGTLDMSTGGLTFFTYARCSHVKDGLYALPTPGVEMEGMDCICRYSMYWRCVAARGCHGCQCTVDEIMYSGVADDRSGCVR